MGDELQLESIDQDQKAALFSLPARFRGEDLTELSRAGKLSPAILDSTADGHPGETSILSRLLERMARTLYRKRGRHVLVTGQRGVGKTTLVWELARQAASLRIPFLKSKRFLWLDCENVSPEESRHLLSAVASFASEQTDLILCLDGLGSLLRSAGGVTNKPFFRSVLKQDGIQIIGVMSQWDFDELLSSDAEIAELCTRVDLPEPDETASFKIVQHAARQLEQTYGVAIEAKALKKAVVLSARFIWNQQLPTKAIRILERVCEDQDYERTQLGSIRNEIETADVIRVMADISHVPEEMLSGDPGETDYEQVLGSVIIGQDEAVRTVATELRLIKAGITDRGKPASVMLFCGLNGVGKTEMAKRLAEIYSASKRLQVYTMGNYVESHSISGIIGVPAGYVGHEQGGRLINDLNADPYGVFLLDEIEKSHPDVLKPFLNLFDEGWIVDQRGVKAYADRAIFILTSNAGYDAIAQMHQAKRPMDEIVEHAKSTLARVRNDRSGQPVLSQAFLARIKRIVVFNPLDDLAMHGITRLLVQQVQRDWSTHRDKTLTVSDEFISKIARQALRLNEKSGGREGGRGVRRLIADLVEDPVQRAAVGAGTDYRNCTEIELGLLSPSANDDLVLTTDLVAARFR